MSISLQNRLFVAAFSILGGSYLLLILGMLFVDVLATSPDDFTAAFRRPELRAALRLSLLSSALAAVVALWVAVPLGYLLARYRFRGSWLVELIIEVPIVLPPLVVGLSLLLLFQSAPGQMLQKIVPITYSVPAVVIAQFVTAAAFATRLIKVAFEQISPRFEEMAASLGATQAQIFWRIAFPQARRGILAAGTLAWARSLGEFGPVLVFAGVTRFRTEVLPTAIYLELSLGNLSAALALAWVLIFIAASVLLLLRISRTGEAK
jgi:molybdate transport system permease protein